MFEIKIIKKGITELEADCVVNAANSDLYHGGGVCGAIFNAAGANLLTKACNEIGHCDTGNAVITPAFNLTNYKYIIHAVGPIYSSRNIQKCRENLYNAYIHSLEVMLENNCYSIVFPLISSGIYGYPIEEAWKIAIKACNQFVIDHKAGNFDIKFAVIDNNVLQIGRQLLKGMTNPITKLLETVSYLHSKGYEKLRVMISFSPSGCYLRCLISIKENFDDLTGFVILNNDRYPVYRYSTGAEYRFFNNEESYEYSSIEDIANKLFEEYPELEKLGKGKDTEYVNWFKNIVALANNDIYPYAFADYDYDIYKANGIKLTNGEYIEYAPTNK